MKTVRELVVIVGLIVAMIVVVIKMPEDDGGAWSCVDDGNKICAPGNERGVPPGQYDQGGVLVDPWPIGR